MTRDIFNASSKNLSNETVAISCIIDRPRPVLLYCQIVVIDSEGHESFQSAPIFSSRKSRVVINGLKPDRLYMYNATLSGLKNVCSVVKGTFTLDSHQHQGKLFVE